MRKIRVNCMILGMLLIACLSVPSVIADNLNLNNSSKISQLNKDGTCTVRKGDTIWSIGMRYNVNPKVIEQMNGNDSNNLQVGSVVDLHVYDHGEKASLTLTIPQKMVIKRDLNFKDKLNKKESFGRSIRRKSLNKKQKKTMKRDISVEKRSSQSKEA